MELEKQVVSLELAKRLKELGVPQNSLFEYRLFNITSTEDFWSKPIMVGQVPEKIGEAYVGGGRLSAFTVAELGELLPKTLPGAKYQTFLQQHWKMKRDHYCNCEQCKADKTETLVVNLGYWNGGVDLEGEAENEADARAKLLIQLIERKMITP
jgi:hypothetical protein